MMQINLFAKHKSNAIRTKYLYLVYGSLFSDAPFESSSVVFQYIYVFMYLVTFCHFHFFLYMQAKTKFCLLHVHFGYILIL